MGDHRHGSSKTHQSRKPVIWCIGVLRGETCAGALLRQVAGFVIMKEIENELRKLVARGEFAIDAAASLDHGILHLQQNPSDIQTAVSLLRQHRDCMVILHDLFRIEQR